VHADIEPFTEALKAMFAAKLPENPAEDQPTVSFCVLAVS
jgi:hypothetical protein